MRINKIENQPSFGIKCLNADKLDKKVIKTFKQSALVKKIDEKYPDALIMFTKQDSIDFFGKEIGYNNLDTYVSLSPDKNFNLHLSDKKRGVVEKKFLEFIRKTSLEELEQKTIKES